MVQGAGAKIHEAGAVILGGHTINDEELKYGLAVTGMVHPEEIVTNQNARPGDVLILTKPLGTGVISTALKAGKASTFAVEKINRSMKTLNNTAAKAMMEIGVHACTYVTGFGLLGHALQLAQASKVSLAINSAEVPIFEEALIYAEMKLFPGGTLKNEKFVNSFLSVDSGIDREVYMLLCDAQTSGGLLITAAAAKGQKLLSEFKNRGVESAQMIGEVLNQQEKVIYIK